ncbi:hypothetical protein NXW38_01380 [Bacteroides ovatus]|nr:hypothetical protein [Bacteroides ovatus]MCS3099161.1 hypothetical protein [Bacteroides ovatus]UVQ62815.1 hypothetical protein NXX44_16325 [Bacteroides ovatus]
MTNKNTITPISILKFKDLPSFDKHKSPNINQQMLRKGINDKDNALTKSKIITPANLLRNKALRR